MDEQPEAFTERSPKSSLTRFEIGLFAVVGLILTGFVLFGTWGASQMGGPGVLPG